MEKIVFAEGWRDFFSQYGFKSFDDFFRYSGGSGIHTGGKRNVRELSLCERGEEKVIFIKRFNYPQFSDIAGSWVQFGRPLSQAAVEWENANYLLNKNIGTYKPVCFGEKTTFGLERKSFFVSEKIEGQCLTDFVRENWNKISRQQKEELMAELGRFVRKIHNAGINFPDLYVWHIFLNDDKQRDKTDFSIIDLHRMRQNVTERKKHIHNLGRFKYSMLDEYFDRSLYMLFIESYAGGNWPEEVDELAAKVRKYSHIILGKRNQKRY